MDKKSKLDNKNRIMLGVSQGCYAEITTETPENIIGLFTDGMGPCVCLIVTNTDRSHFFLAHVDSYMNIADPNLGLPAWIRKIQKSSDGENIEIHCGKGYQVDTFKIDYEALINKILKANNMQQLLNCVQMYYFIDISASLIMRCNQEIFIYSEKKTYSGIKYDLDGRPIGGVKTELSDSGIQIVCCQQIGYQTRNHSINYLEEEAKANINNSGMCEYVKMKYEVCKKTGLPFTSNEIDTSLPFPPICCYDGIETSISIEQYKDKINEYKQRLIKLFNDKTNLSKYNKELCYSFLRREFNNTYNHIEYKMFREGRFK